MHSYQTIVRRIIREGQLKPNRTGVDTRSLSGVLFEHDMGNGFPLLTTKRVPFRSVKVELEGFINGVTDKRWYQERKCTIWDEWCSPAKVPYGHSSESFLAMRNEPDLGPIYGAQWRSFNGIDQLANILRLCQDDPKNRRLICSAWNPTDIPAMALPPCHFAFQLLVNNGKLDLLWSQRSVDTMLGLPFNIASYALLLHLIARHCGLLEGKLIGFLADTHIYVNQMEGAVEQLSRESLQLPTLETVAPSNSIFLWKHDDSKLVGYDPHPAISFPIAI
jgi:thymidylate synthase